MLHFTIVAKCIIELQCCARAAAVSYLSYGNVAEFSVEACVTLESQC